MSEKFKYSDEKIKSLLDGIYSGEITEYNIPEDLYFSIADYLKSGVYQGFGGDLTKFKGQDLELLTELRENTYMFSAAKSYQELKEIGSLMFNEDGSIRNQREFTQLGERTFEKWNEAWGLTERQTAIGQAQMASKWNEIEKNKDLLPILVFSTAGKGCEECAPYDNFSAKVEDQIWSWLSPLLHFNCECILMQEEGDYPVTDKDEYDKIAYLKDNVPVEFQMNPGKDKIIFSDEHPYFQVAKKDIPFAKENFGLPIPSVAEEMGKPITGLSLEEAKKIMPDFKLLKAEREAISDYTGGTYNQINGYERGIRNKISEEAKITTKNLDKFIERAPKVQAESYRGMTADTKLFDEFKALKKGDVYTDKAFMSTTYDKNIVSVFSGNECKIEMTLKGKNGVLIEPFSQYGAKEKEIIFGRNSHFKVESIKVKGDGRTYVRGSKGNILLTLVEV